MWPFNQYNQPIYQQYASAYDTGNYSGFDQNQVFGHIQQFMQGAPFDLQQNVYQQHFAQMPYQQRAFLAQQIPPQYGMDPNNPYAMAQGFTRFGQEQPGMLAQLLSHPLLLGSGVVLAGLIAKHVLAHNQWGGGGYGAIQPPMGDPYGAGWGGWNPGNQEARYEEREARHEEREARREFERAEFNPNPWEARREFREAEHEEREARRDERDARWDRERGW